MILVSILTLAPLLLAIVSKSGAIPDKHDEDEVSRRTCKRFDNQFLDSVINSGAIPCGDNYCKCFRKTLEATCPGKRKNMRYVPRLPSYVQILEIEDNSALTYNGNTFQNLTHSNLTALLLCNCHIGSISESTFSGLQTLSKLEVSGSTTLAAHDLMLAFNDISESIETLFLDNNGWNNLPDNMFQYLTGRNVNKLDLNDNRLESFNGSILLKYIPRLKELNLRSNSLNSDNLDFGNMHHVQHLDLRSNCQLRKVPKFCMTTQENSSQSQLPYLLSLLLSETSLRVIDKGAFNCLLYLRKLHLNNNPITNMPNETFAYLPNLETLSLDGLFRLKSLHPKSFESQSLKNLSFQSKFDFERNVRISVYYNDIFSFCPNLEKLQISGNRIASGSLFKSLLASLSKLRTLWAVGVFLFDLQEKTFDHMQQLETLSLEGNNLGSWPDSVFSKMFNLRDLYLDGNVISVVKQSMLPDGLLRNLSSIHLGDNPYSCTCDLIWFRDWTRKNTKLLRAYPKSYKCWTPKTWSKKLLSDFNVTAAEICTEQNVWDVLKIVLPVSACSCVFVIFIIYHQIPLIRNVIYLIRLRRSGYVKLINEEIDYMFSAFFIFSEKDRKWVIKYLLPVVEGDGLRACVPDRDFVAGDSYSDQLGENITNSRKLVVVLTNNFANDEWCQWQLQLVQEKVRQLGKACVVVILLKEIDTKHMTSSIRQMLKMCPYVTWASGSLRQRLFNKVVLRALHEPLGNPPTAIPSYGSISS